MRKPKVFISSTYLDLKREREIVSEVISKVGAIPTGIDFSYSDFNDISKSIAESDYLLLIVGKKYGSIETNSGKSYVEQEYDYARKNGIPILTFISMPEPAIVTTDYDKIFDESLSLDEFKNKISKQNLVSYFKSEDELKAQVFHALHDILSEENTEFSTKIDQLNIIVDTGMATNDEIADYLADLSIFYRMTGGSGINFENTGIIHLQNELVHGE